jgi:hypothetical protein
MEDVAGEMSTSVETTDSWELPSDPKFAGSTFGWFSPRPAPSSPNPESFFFDKNYLLSDRIKINSAILRQLPKVR